MSFRCFSAITAAVACVFTVSTASAHIDLSSPTPRIPGDNNKVSPCGGGAWGDSGSITYAPGDVVTLQFNETVPHPGYFRVAIGLNGDADLPLLPEDDFELFKSIYNDDPPPATPAEVVGPVQEGNLIILRDYHLPHGPYECPTDTMDGPSCAYSVEVTIPEINCAQCTLQLVQMMAEAGRVYPDSGYYYHCVDITVEGAIDPGGMGGMGNVGGQPAMGGSGSAGMPVGMGGAGGMGQGGTPAAMAGMGSAGLGSMSGVGGAAGGGAVMASGAGGMSAAGAPGAAGGSIAGGPPASTTGGCALSAGRDGSAAALVLGLLGLGLLGRRRRSAGA